MSIEHKLFDNRSIIISTISGQIDLQDVLSICKVVDGYLTNRGLSKVYWVMDVADVIFSHETAIQMAEETAKGLPGSGGDPRVVPLIIMPEERYAYVENEMENRHFSMPFPLFHTLNDAYTFALFLSCSDNIIKAS